ncbi:hypothetical protein JTB14_007824 [Gonioctena quinquepunctata]|nr:hypothetical protein JTB14_007824 [Gonioctena quinquepunctata]
MEPHFHFTYYESLGPPESVASSITMGRITLGPKTTLERKKYSRQVPDVDTNHALPPETITYDKRDPYKGDFANSEELRVWFRKIAHVEVISKIAQRQG